MAGVAWLSPSSAPMGPSYQSPRQQNCCDRRKDQQNDKQSNNQLWGMMENEGYDWSISLLFLVVGATQKYKNRQLLA